MPFKDRATKRAYDLARYYERRQAFFASKRCAICGGDDGLELHHTDKTSKESHRIWSWSHARREAELAKCVVLCRWCHQEIHAAEKRKPLKHGTIHGYRSGCRCDQCRAAHAARMREYRARRKEYEPLRV